MEYRKPGNTDVEISTPINGLIAIWYYLCISRGQKCHAEKENAKAASLQLSEDEIQVIND